MSRAPEPSLDGSNFSICAARARTRALRILTDQDAKENSRVWKQHKGKFKGLRYDSVQCGQIPEVVFYEENDGEA